MNRTFKTQTSVETGPAISPEAKTGLRVIPMENGVCFAGIQPAGPIGIAVLSPQGAPVRVLPVDSGSIVTTWDGRDATDCRMPNGMYIAQCRIAGTIIRHAFSLVR